MQLSPLEKATLIFSALSFHLTLCNFLRLSVLSSNLVVVTLAGSPTAKTGLLFGGAAFLAHDASLFFQQLISGGT
jgi:hypothetical protein